MSFNYNITGQSITVYIDEDVRTYDRTSKVGKDLVEGIRSGASNESLEKIVFAFRNEIEALGAGILVGDNDCIEINNESVPRELGLLMKEFSNDGAVLQPLMNFWNKLKTNPNPRSIQCLFDCLNVNKHPLTVSGNVVCWKRVAGNLNDPKGFRDLRTGTFDNSVGKVVQMPREEVDSDPDKTCSRGLHCSSYSYAKNQYSNGILLEVLLNPYHCVAVPRDYNNSKIRCCEYTVLKVVDDERQDRIVPDNEWDISEEEFQQLI